MIYPVHPSAVLKAWPQAKPWLEKAFEFSQFDTAADHLAPLLRDEEQLWHIHGKAWAITRVVEGKKGRVIQCIALGGREMHEWRDDFMRHAEEWGKRHGCVGAQISGRVGWLRAKPPSYRAAHVTFEKEF